MKRMFLLAFAMSLLVVSASAQTSADPLAEQAVALASRLGELAASEGYVAAYGASSAVGEIVAEWAKGDYGAPAAIHRATLDPDKALSLVAGLSGTDAPFGLSETAYEELSRRMLGSLASMINGTAGAETIAAASLMTVQTAMVCESCDAPTLYVLRYERGTPVAVTFQPCQDGAALVQTCFLALPAGDALDAALFGALAMLGAEELEEIPLP